MDKGLVTPVKINSMILNYDEQEFAEKMFMIQKSGNGQKAYQLEKEYAQKSLRRKLFFRKLIDKFQDKTLKFDYNIKLIDTNNLCLNVQIWDGTMHDYEIHLKSKEIRDIEVLDKKINDSIEKASDEIYDRLEEMDEEFIKKHR